jgi:hypothetical protein
MSCRLLGEGGQNVGGRASRMGQDDRVVLMDKFILYELK